MAKLFNLNRAKQGPPILTGRTSFSGLPAAPVVPFRYGMMAATMAVAIGFPSFQDFGVTIAAANPVIPYRTTDFIETTPPAVPIASQYGRVMPFAATVASANPVIGYRYGQASLIEPSVPVVPQRGPVPSPQPYAVPAPRIVSVPPAESLILPVSRYTPFPFVSVAIDPANPVIPYRLGQPLASEPPANVPSQYISFPFVSVAVDPANPVIPPRITSPFPETSPDLIRAAFYQFPYLAPTVAPANAVIPIVTRTLSELREQTATTYPAFTPYSYTDTALAANPVVPYRMGQWIGDASPDAFVPPRYQPFPYWQGVVDPANPVIPIRIGQLPSDEVPPLVGIQGYQRFPVTNNEVTPTFPIIPYRTRLLSELARVELPPQSAHASYLYNPYATPVIPVRMGQWIGDEASRAFVPPQYQRFPYWQGTVDPANPVIPIRVGQWPSDAVPPLVGIQGYQPFPYWQAPVPASPVIPFRVGQWIGDAVQPLVGIHGYRAFPWTNNSLTPNLHRLFLDVETGNLYYRLNATTPLIVRVG
jgi:hypothetical protein